jgi:hypothetical protein
MSSDDLRRNEVDASGRAISERFDESGDLVLTNKPMELTGLGRFLSPPA